MVVLAMITGPIELLNFAADVNMGDIGEGVTGFQRTVFCAGTRGNGMVSYNMLC